MSHLKQFCIIEFPASGRVYQIPSKVIADDRIKARLAVGLSESEDEVREEVYASFADDFTMVEWAKNNMDWSEIEQHAMLLEVRPRKVSSEWDDASITPVDIGRTPATMDQVNALDVPLEAVLTSMAFAGEEVSIVAINADQPVSAAIVVLQGQTDVVSGYLATITKFNDFMAKQRQVDPSKPLTN